MTASPIPYPSAAKNGRTRHILVPLLVAAVAIAGGLGLFQTLSPAAAATSSGTRMLVVSGHPLHKAVTHDQVHPQKPDWSISIATVGLQAEIDQCEWVRMDFTSAVPLPIVAAHNFCGGGIVLEMQVGQSVELSGTGLDGTYRVVGSKDAWADDDAADAIAGLTGDVVLQTCFWENDGHLILVALQRVS